VITITDQSGNSAVFSQTGDLIGWNINGIAWQLPKPTPGWSLISEIEDCVHHIKPALSSGHIVTATPSGIDVSFCNFGDSDYMADLTVTVQWRMDQGVLQGNILIAGKNIRTITEIVLPDIDMAYGDAAATSIIVPREFGVVIHGAAELLSSGDDKNNPLAFTYPLGHMMQCFGWTEKDKGLYTDCRDEQGYIKTWQFAHTEEGLISLKILHHMPVTDADMAQYQLPYKVSLGSFNGSWYDMSQIYRRWAITTKWASRSSAQRAKGMFDNIACWVWNRGRIAEVVDPVIELRKRIGLPIALDWYWWHKHAYDIGYPDYFPPREGEAFPEAIARLQQNQVYVQIYTNGVGYDMDGDLWQPDGPSCAIINKDGSMKSAVYNAFIKHRMAIVCGAAQRWHDICLKVADQAADLGIDALYIDLIAAQGGGWFCYSKEHGHAPGGGCYGVQGFRSLLEKVRAKHPQLLIASEATIECYQDLLDGCITCAASYERLKYQAEKYGGRGRLVPLFTAVYHGHFVGFGNYAMLDAIPPFDEKFPPEYRPDSSAEKDWVALYPDQFAFELARTVVYGSQPMVSNLKAEHFKDSRFSDDIDYLVTISREYHQNRKYLLWGRLLPPGTMETESLEIKFLQRFIYTAPGKETELARTYPAVLHSEWQADDGSCAVFMTNYARHAVNIAYTPPAGFRLTGVPVGDIYDGIYKTVLPPRSCRTLTLEPLNEVIKNL